MHIHLDLVGGMAGDMFIGSVLDVFPQFEDPLLAELKALKSLPSQIKPDLKKMNDGTFHGKAFRVKGVQEASANHHNHTHFSRIRRDLEQSHLTEGAKSIALDIFQILAEAEAGIHDKPVDKVAFHEVGAHDSIADIVGAALLINWIGCQSWSVSAIPLGSGRVDTCHGEIPIPAPATLSLLKGFEVYDDGREGERVTPTGAAILKYLKPTFQVPDGLQIQRHGHGFGTKKFPGMSNILRLTTFEPSFSVKTQLEEMALLTFEVDDQSPEDFAVGVENLRKFPGVVDVIYQTVFGKKGRFALQVQVMAEPAHSSAVSDQCFHETPTLGLREERVRRRVLTREHHDLRMNGELIKVKAAKRPSGHWTAKTEMDSARFVSGFAKRRALRREAEEKALGTSQGQRRTYGSHD